MPQKRKATTTKKRISRRVVNTKRHTTGYIIGGETVSVAQARKMATRGQVAGVRVVGNHIQAAVGCRPLSNLPVKIDR